MTLQELGLNHGTDKATHHNFMDFYDNKFKNLRYKKINLLEIGFLKGSSIKTWLDYFENSTIYSIDIIDIDFKHERFIYNKISQTDENLLNLFDDKYFDIIIDDGSHFTSHQIKSLELLWSKLKNNGFYVIEDLHTSFRQDYITTEITPYDFLKKNREIKTLSKIKNEISNIEIFYKNPNYLYDSITSILTKNNDSF